MSNRKRARKRRAVGPAAVTAPPAAPPRPTKQQARPKPEPRRAAPVAPGVPFERGALIGAGGAALVAFVIYALTVQPSVPAGDSGVVNGVFIAQEGSSPQQMQALQERVSQAVRDDPSVDRSETTSLTRSPAMSA